MSLCLYKLKKLNINDIQFKLYQPKDKKKYAIKCFNKKGQNIMIETIPMYSPYGINTKTLIQNTLQLTISLSSRLIDQNTEKFYKDLCDFEQHIVNNEDKFISNSYSCKSMSMISCIDDNDKINFYTQDISKDTFLVYDPNNNIIDNKEIKSRSFVQCIIWLSGIWINNDTYGINWKLVQCKLFPDIFSIDKCLFLDEEYDVREIFYNNNNKKLPEIEDKRLNASQDSNTDHYEKYKKMLKLGIPEGAVILECKKDGVDPKEIGINIVNEPIVKPKLKQKSKPLPLPNNDKKSVVSKLKPPTADELKAQIALLKKTNYEKL